MSKVHLVRGDRTACGMSGSILRRLSIAEIPSSIPFVILNPDRREHYLSTVTCLHCIRRRNDL